MIMAGDKIRRQFGRELEALLSVTQEDKVVKQNSASMLFLSIDQLQVSPYQPRQHFNEAALKELADSIKEQGILQPIVAREKGTYYEIIAGERRFRAAKLAGILEVPVVIHNVPDYTALAFALIENIQRQDLNPLEEAQALHRLLTEFSMTHEQVAGSVGRSRTAVTNILRLLNLSQTVKDHLLTGKIDMGHARALIPLSTQQQIDIANIIIAKKLSVRETEGYIQRQQIELQQPKSSALTLNPKIKVWEEDLFIKLASKSYIKINSHGAGKIMLSFSSIKNLEEIIRKICD